MPTPVLFSKVLLICKDQSEYHFLSSPGSGLKYSRTFSLVLTQAYYSHTGVQPCTHISTLLPHTCSALHAHKHTAPTMAASPASLLIRSLCAEQGPGSGDRAVSPGQQASWGFPPSFHASALGWSWHPVLLGQGVITVYTTDDDSGVGAPGLSDC